MAEATKKDVKAKATSPAGKAELVIGAGAKALSKAVNEAKKVLLSIESATQISEALTDEIATKQSELEILDVQYTEKERQLKVNLDLAIQEQKGDAIFKYLGEAGQEPVNSAEYAKLKGDLNSLKTDFDTAVGKETAVIRNQEASKYNSQKALDAAEAKATNAGLTARLDAATEKITFYEDEVQNLRDQLSSERDARVKEAQARGNSQVTVNNGK